MFTNMCSNDDLGFTFTYLMAGSNVVPYTAVFEEGMLKPLQSKFSYLYVQQSICKRFIKLKTHPRSMSHIHLDKNYYGRLRECHNEIT